MFSSGLGVGEELDLSRSCSVVSRCRGKLYSGGILDVPGFKPLGRQESSVSV